MKNTILKYLSNLEYNQIDYKKLKTIRQKFLSNHISFYIPQWNYLGKRNIELISNDHGLVLFGTIEKSTVLYNTNEEHISSDIFSILNKIEMFISEFNNNFPVFYSGILAYESANFLEKIPSAKKFYNLPDYYLLFPGNTLLIDHSKKKIHEYKLKDNISPFHQSASKNISNDEINIVINEDKSAYTKKINRIRDLIFSGEVYQINYTIRFSKAIMQDGYEFFKHLYEINPAPFSFYAGLPHCEIISSSPERFIQLDKNKVLTQPIKGTIKRTENDKANKKLMTELLSSEKDAAELSMIVDLLRNDISIVCKAGSVKVEKHRELAAFSNVYHLISTITGDLRKNTTYVDLLKAVFPGGSITGCPKIAAMKYIADLEMHERSFYTGSFFLRFPSENSMDSNILIRTAIKKDNQIHFQAGGGIVIDSGPDLEYNECLAKTSSFLKVMDKLT
jgi:para-aminobenzoate synthetase component 1